MPNSSHVIYKSVRAYLLLLRSVSPYWTLSAMVLERCMLDRSTYSIQNKWDRNECYGEKP